MKTHEIRDPIHGFIKITDDERLIVDSAIFQRLRNIHQLALTYLIYPGATHTRFEHSLGVMELATRIYDCLTVQSNMIEAIRNQFPELLDQTQREYYRSIVRFAALCHDLGHLPFSHAAEKEILPENQTHETITINIIQKYFSDTFRKMTPSIRVEDVIKVAVGQEKAINYEFSPLESILSEIIVSDTFGADRMDYLLRDSHYTGVASGKFDYLRLIDSLRILIPPKTDSIDISNEQEHLLSSQEPTLGVVRGGLHAVESLIIARFFIYSQVCFHPIRLVYNDHLQEYMKELKKSDKNLLDISNFSSFNDYTVYASMIKASIDKRSVGHINAKRIVDRNHFKILYQNDPNDNLNFQRLSPAITATRTLFNKISEDSEFSKEDFIYKISVMESKSKDFPVLGKDERIISALSLSNLLYQTPNINEEYIFVSRDKFKSAKKWLEYNRENILKNITGV